MSNEQAPEPREDIVQRLRDASRGHEEWRVVSNGGISMLFSRHGQNAVRDPEREAMRWLSVNQRAYVGRYTDHKVEMAMAMSSSDRLMAEASDEIERLLGIVQAIDSTNDALCAENEKLRAMLSDVLHIAWLAGDSVAASHAVTLKKAIELLGDDIVAEDE